MENDKKKKNDSLEGAIENVAANEHQNLENENLGIEPEEQTEGDPNSKYRMEGFDDKRPDSDEVKKGWTVDSDTSRNPDDLH